MPSRKKNTPSRQKPAAKKTAVVKQQVQEVSKNRTVLWAALFVFFAAGLLALHFYSQQQMTKLAAPLSSSEVTLLERELSTARQRIDQLGRKLNEIEQAPKEDAALRQQLVAYQQRIEALEKSQAETARRSGVHQQQNYVSALLVAVLTIQQNIQAGLPFEQQVKAAELITRQHYSKAENSALYDAIFKLQAASSMGVKTYEELMEIFNAATMQVMHLHHQAWNQQGWWGRIKALLSKFITVRSLSPSGDSVEAVLARAEIALKQKNISLASSHISQLPPSVKKGAEEWLQAAQSYIITQQALRVLQDFLNNALMAQVVPDTAPNTAKE